MPFCVMLETALQPCGWLASFVGGALGSEENLYFRNLDGQGTQHQELPPDVGTLTVTTTLTRVSATDGIVILGFAVAMRAGDAPVYTLETVFGFFPGDTMANQAGLPVSPEARAALDEEGLVTVDLAARPARYFGGALRLPTDRLAMLDRVTGLWPTGGKGGLGRVRADKRVRASDWFFKAHFFQDPVQPGSLGLEAMLQAVEVLAIELGLGEGLAAPRFEAQASGVTMRWKYRGQVVPENGVVVVDVALTELRREPGTVLLVAEGSLWVDGKRIYEATGLGVRVTSRPPR
jgi:3-hydroxymyristoyl/3-hydroxydecanoyl-(acyl carrier protein) dehydratase